MVWSREVQEDGIWEAGKKSISRMGREELWQKDEEAVNYVVEAEGHGP